MKISNIALICAQALTLSGLYAVSAHAEEQSWIGGGVRCEQSIWRGEEEVSCGFGGNGLTLKEDLRFENNRGRWRLSDPQAELTWGAAGGIQTPIRPTLDLDSVHYSAIGYDLRAGAYVEYLPLRATLTRGLINADTELLMEATHSVDIAPQVNVEGSVFGRWVDGSSLCDRYHPNDAARSCEGEWAPGVAVIGTYEFKPGWAAQVHLGYEQLHKTAEDSILVQRQDSTYAQVGVRVRY